MIELSLRAELRSPFDFGTAYAQGERFRGSVRAELRPPCDFGMVYAQGERFRGPFVVSVML